MDRNNELHGASHSYYEIDTYGDYERISSEAAEDMDDDRYTTSTCFYWHGRYVEQKEYAKLSKQHQMWLKELERIDAKSFRQLFEDPAFVTDFYGSVDLWNAALSNRKILSADYLKIKTSDKNLAESLAFLSKVRSDQDKGIVTKLASKGTIEVRYQVKNGKKNGWFEEYLPTGELCSRCHYVDDQLDGPYERYTLQGNLYSRYHYTKGVLNGPYQEDGFIGNKLHKKCTYKNGVLDGPYYEVDGPWTLEDQTLIKKEGVYKDGKFTGIEKTFSRRDQSICEVAYEDDHKHGPFVEYYDKEQTMIKTKGTYRHGHLYGLYETYYPNGGVHERIRFDYMGEAQGIGQLFTPDGKEKSRHFYLNDELADDTPMGHDKTRRARKGMRALLGAIDKLPAGKGRKTLKNTAVKTYRRLSPSPKSSKAYQK